MATLTWNMLGYGYQEGLKILRACYEASNLELEEALQRARDEAFGYQQHIEQGGEEEGEWEDGHWLWTKDQILDLRIDASTSAVWEVRRAYAIALYHHWERGARKWTNADQFAGHKKLVGLVAALGVKPTPGLDDLYLIANTLKHNNPKWGQQLMDSKPDLVNAAQLAWLANGDWYDAVQIPHADMLELFESASESGATLNTPFK